MDFNVARAGLGNLKIAFAIDARTLAHDYDTNEVGADLKYKGKRILVTGVLDSINKTFLDKPYVVLVGYQFRTVNAGFGRKDADSLADLRKRQTASFVREVSGMSLSDVYLKKCSTFGVYANTLRSDIGRKIADALNGKVQVSKDEAQRIARLYVTAAYFAKNLPQDSSCF